MGNSGFIWWGVCRRILWMFWWEKNWMKLWEEFVFWVLEFDVNIVVFCCEYIISWKIGYKWFKCFCEVGIVGFVDLFWCFYSLLLWVLGEFVLWILELWIVYFCWGLWKFWVVLVWMLEVDDVFSIWIIVCIFEWVGMVWKWGCWRIMIEVSWFDIF